MKHINAMHVWIILLYLNELLKRSFQNFKTNSNILLIERFKKCHSEKQSNTKRNSVKSELDLQDGLLTVVITEAVPGVKVIERSKTTGSWLNPFDKS